MTEASADSNGPFEGKNPEVRLTYDAIIAGLAAIGPFTEEVRQDSIHLAHSVTFASIHPHQDHLILTFRANHPIAHERIERSEQASDSRWHVEVRLGCSAEVDDQVRDWLSAAMELI